MSRSVAERRHHRDRVISKRLGLIATRFGGQYGLGRRGAGSLAKDHLTNCSCWLCKPHKHEPKDRQRQAGAWKREAGLG